MTKQIISLILSLSMLCYITLAFAKENESAISGDGLINIESITEDNVIYNALQNKRREVSLFGANSSYNSITAAFDVVLGFDMSSAMYGFDYNGEKIWLDNFKALSEQVPSGTRFAVVTDEKSEFTNDLDEEIDAAKQMDYCGTSDAINLLENCEYIFDSLSNDRNKVIIAVTTNVSNTVELEKKLNSLSEEGILAFVFVVDMSYEGDIENVYPCKTGLDLRLGISDLYLSFAEYSIASLNEVESENNTNYRSDFRAKHKFSDNLTADTNGGILLAEILNIYSCVPMYAEINNTDIGYDLFEIFKYVDGDEIYYYEDILKAFLEADNAKFSLNHEDELMSFKSAWEMIFELAQQNENLNGNNFWIEDDSEINNVIDKNLKRRFPVVAMQESGYSIIQESGDYNATAVFDTYEYIMHSLIHGTLSDSSELINVNNQIKNEITIQYPSTYIVNSDKKDKVKISNTDIDLMKSGNVVKFQLSQDQDVIAESLVTYTDGICNIVNANSRYITRLYTDINNSSLWYYDYVYKATNKSIINGYEDNNTYSFRPEPKEGQSDTDTYGKVTRGEFLKIIMSAIGYPVDEPADAALWAEEHIIRANNMGALLDFAYNDYPANFTKTEKQAYQDAILSRKEAAYILTKIFIDNENTDDDKLPQVPSMLYKYEETNSSAMVNNWNGGSIFIDLGTADEETDGAIFQMYANGVINGYGDGTFQPERYITRAEACKIIIKSLFSLDDIETIIPNIYGSDYDGLEIGEVKTNTFDSSGSFTYEVVVDREGRFTEYTDGTYSGNGYLYQISTKGKNITYNLTDEKGDNIECVSGESAPKYRLKAGQIVRIHIIGMPNTEFSVVMNDCWSDSKKNYIVLYDSYDDQFQEVLGEGVTSRYRNENGANYTYSEKFFKNYFEVLGNRKASFIIALRDLYADGTTRYTIEETDTGTSYVKSNNMLTLSELYINSDFMNNVVSKTSERYNDIIDYMEDALNELNAVRTEQIPFPEIYLASPHFMYSSVSDADGGVSMEDNLVAYYTEISKRIYENVAQEQGEDKITGMDFGKEDPHNIYRNYIVEDDASGAFSMTYKSMQSMSNFLHDLGKKLLWIPYSTNEEEWENIGEIVNTGTDKNGNGILDVFMMQPGLFYSDYNEGLISNDIRIQKQSWLRNSVIQCKFVDGNGNTIGGEKKTNTDIAFQIEFDISLVTGRNYNGILPKEADDPILMNTFPQQAAENFIKTYKWYRDLITDGNTSMGMYIGGPGEQDYENSEGNNDSLHSRLNHPSALSVKVSDNGYTEIGEGMAFNDFFWNIKEINSNAYYKDYYDNRLIADITKGLLYNNWSKEVKEYLNMDANMDKFPLPENR